MRRIERAVDDFARRLVALRQRRGWKQCQLARVARMPVASLNALEVGRRSGGHLALGTACRLAQALGVSVDYLATGRGRGRPVAPEALYGWPRTEEQKSVS